MPQYTQPVKLKTRKKSERNRRDWRIADKYQTWADVLLNSAGNVWLYSEYDAYVLAVGGADANSRVAAVSAKLVALRQELGDKLEQQHPVLN